MDKESSLPSASLPFDHKHQRSQRKEPHTASTSPITLPNPYLAEESLRSAARNQSGGGLKRSPAHAHRGSAGKGGDASRNHGYSSSRHVRHTGDELMRRDRSLWDPPAKTSVSHSSSPAQGRVMDKNPLEAQRRGFRDVHSAPNSAGKSKPAQADLAPFEVKMTDFPELAGISLGKAGTPPVQRDCWGRTPPSTSTVTQTSAFSWRSGRTRSPPRPDVQQISTNTNSDSPAAAPGQSVVTSWANVASQPPKKPVLNEKTISNNHMQMEEATAQQEDQVQGKKKRKKKKKKAKGDGEDAETEIEEPIIYQEPPKFEDEEEFPGLAIAGNDRLRLSSNVVKLCNEENQREGVQHQSVDKSKEKTPPAKNHPTEASKKGQKAEKVSGKKSKVPVQLDIGNMLATLEKKQQSQKAKKPVILSVGGGLAVVQKELVVQKKLPWQQDKIAHNPLDSTGPGVKKGKQREVPKAKKPTPLKKVILKEREERKQKRLLEERGLLPENEPQPAPDDAAAAAEEEEQCDSLEMGAEQADVVGGPAEEPDKLPEVNGANPSARDGDEETDKDDVCDQETVVTVSCPNSRPKIHSRKFRDYCSQMLSKEVDKCVTALLKELVRFQDRLYQRDPMKARMRRRIVMGLREVLKHLKLHKVKCVVISPNCERIQSKGGLDEALYTIIDTCREQGVPYVFALSRKALGRCVNKAVPVSLVGIFNYDGAQDFYHQMIELSSEARKAYEVMVLSLEETGPAEEEQLVKAEDELHNNNSSNSSNSPPGEAEATPADEPEYMKAWKKMLEKDCNHKYLNFEEQLSAMRLASECTENTDAAEKS